MEILKGKRSEFIDADAFHYLHSPYEKVVMDLGTGDGKFLYRLARENRAVFHIGIDPCREQLEKISSKIYKKPARGGLDNIIFVIASLENMPAELNGLADRIYINYPWSGLLRKLITPDKQSIRQVRRLGKTGATIEILLNYSIFEDKKYLERANLPDLMDRSIIDLVDRMYRELGIDIEGMEFFHEQDDAPQPTSWGRKLTRGSGRMSLKLLARFI